MTLDNMAGITNGSYTGFCKSQLITCNRVKECNGVCPFEDALKHADKEMNEQTVIDHDRDWIIGCIEHDGFIHTHRFDKANQIIHDALSTDAVQGWIPVSERLPDNKTYVLTTIQVSGRQPHVRSGFYHGGFFHNDNGETWVATDRPLKAWMPLPEPWKDGEK